MHPYHGISSLGRHSHSWNFDTEFRENSVRSS